MRSYSQFNTDGQTELWAGYLHWSILQVRIELKHCNDIPEHIQPINISPGSTYPVRQH